MSVGLAPGPDDATRTGIVEGRALRGNPPRRAGREVRAVAAAGPPDGVADGQGGAGLGLPAPRAPYPPRPSRLDPFTRVFDATLIADLDAPRKQQ